jgi:20S proteasome subunit beta 1
VARGKAPGVGVAAHLFRQVCYEYKDRLLAGIICAGYDEAEGGQVYSISLGGSMVRQAYAIGGSGSTYLYAYCDSHFRRGMTQDECLDFVRSAVAHAMARDGSSGGVIRTVVIRRDGVQRGYVKGDELPVVATADGFAPRE